MASLASRSVGISKFDGLLVPAAELCAIVRASYLSPSFPFLLCFGFGNTSGDGWQKAILVVERAGRRSQVLQVFHRRCVYFEEPLSP